jgi:DNA-binding CsgD family transcriptional regulator/tetratricopeptide (TPR) repeat protein
VPVGRDAELSRLAELIADDTPVAVVGEPGVGKTTVLRQAALASGRPVLEGGALSTLAWLDHLALERAVGRPMVDGDATAIAADVELAVGAGILLLDDLHWAGTATLEVVDLLAGRVGLLAGVRTGDPGTGRALERLQAAGFVQVELAGLRQSAAVELLAQLRPDLATSGRDRLVARAGGNPLLLRELAGTGEPSTSLRLAIEARLRRLDTAGRDAFALLALAGRPVSADALGDAAVKSLLEADLVLAGPGGIEVRHSLLGDVALTALDEGERRGLHARIARSSDDDGEAARHHALAGESERAFAAAMRAADATTRPAERAGHLAVAAAHAAGPEADALRLRAARALEEAHDHDGMIAVLELLSPDDVEAQATAALLRARGAWAAGDSDGLVSALDAGLNLVAGSGSPVEVRLRIERSRVPIFLENDLPAGVAATAAALALGREHDVDVPRAEYLHGTALAVADDVAGESHLRAAIEHARAAGDTSTEFLAANNLISYHESSGDPAAGRAVCAEFIGRARELGLGEWQQSFEVNLRNLDFHAGDYAAVLGAEELLDRVREPRARDLLLEAYCLALIDVGRIDEALRRMDAGSRSIAPDARGRFQVTWVRIEAALWGGRPQLAYELCEQLIKDTPDGDPNLVFTYVSRAWALTDLGRDPGPPAGEQVRPMLLPVPVETAALAALHQGEAAEAAELFARAAGLWAPYHCRGEVRSAWAAGEALRRAGAADAAVRQLEVAEAAAARLGMLPLLSRIHLSLRAAGVRRSAPRTRIAGDTLTGRQRQVLALVAEGLTNAQIATRLGVSRHTVVTQLAAASAKLGATTRGQAASLAAAVS